MPELVEEAELGRRRRHRIGKPCVAAVLLSAMWALAPVDKAQIAAGRREVKSLQELRGLKLAPPFTLGYDVTVTDSRSPDWRAAGSVRDFKNLDDDLKGGRTCAPCSTSTCSCGT